MSRQLLVSTALGLGLIFSQFHYAHAQEWPTKQPLRVVVPYPAGGNADSAARAVFEVVSNSLKQTVVVDNRPGASSIIGTEVVARATPDGYTIGVVSDSHAINQLMSKLPKGSDILGAKVPYDAVKDFIPVAGMIQVPLVLVVHPKVPARTVKELVALSTKNSGVNFGTMGNGSPWFLHMHQMNALTKSTFVDVPYKGLAPAATDLLGGQIEAMVMPVHFAQQHIRAGKLIALATLGSQRQALLPDVPTLSEAGYPGLAVSNYLYFVAPAGTPAAIVERLSREINTALRLPAMREKLMTSGDPYPAETTELSERLLRDLNAYGTVIQTTVK
jgi:tripartite-type tricarboxylate transporter receptor subunit TctC